MIRKFTLLGSLVAAVALVAGACTPGGPAAQTFKVRPTSVKIVDGEDNDSGDEPYVIQVGFRSKVGVAKSSSAQISSQCRTGTLPTTEAPDGTTVTIPAGAADVNLAGVQNLDIGDIAMNNAPFEIIGALTFVAERDAIFNTCALTDAFDSLLVPILTDALDLLIAAQPVPPTQEQLIALLTDNIGSVLSGVLSFVGTILEGLGNPDDIVGVTAQVLLPFSGALAGLVDAGLAIGGIFQPGLETGILPVDSTGLKIRIGNLQPSVTKFTLENPGIATYEYTSTVAAG
jgi:hypothetical protein